MLHLNFMVEPATSPAPAPSALAGLRRVATFAASAALFAALVDALVETWQSQAPARIWVALPIILYLAFMAWLFRQGRRRPPAAQLVWLSSFVLLGATALGTTAEGGLDAGIRLASLPTRVVLSGATAAVVAMAVVSLLQSPLPVVARLVAAVAGVYSIAAFGHGIADASPYARLLQGGADWQRLPYWLQGTVVGALGIVPLALVVEVTLAMARLKVRGRLFRVAAFALGVVLAQAGVTAPLRPAPSAPGSTTPQLRSTLETPPARSATS